MAFQAVPDVAGIEVIYELNGITVENTFYAHFPGGYNQAELDTLAVRIDTRIHSDWILVQPIEAVYIRTEVQGLTIPNDLMATFTSGPTPGGDPARALPNNCTLAIKQTSGFSGRSARGRTYWIGVPSDKVEIANENMIVAGYVTTVLGAMLAMRTGIQSLVGWDAVLVSRVTGGVQRPTGVTFPWIGEVAVNSRVDSQRGRLPRM